MDLSVLSAIAIFAFVMSVTPGPNNIMLLASGAQFGYRQTLPHIFGILLGIASLLISVLLGIDIVFDIYPSFYDALKVIGSIYLCWLAWKVATASTESMAIEVESDEARPLTLISALLFQFSNPKAWAMTIGSVSSFTMEGEGYIESGLWIIFCFAIAGFTAVSLWTCLGVSIAQRLTTVKRKKVFNYTMGIMTFTTLFFILS